MAQKLAENELYQFTEPEKDKIVENALTSASQILLAAAILTNSQRLIEGDIVLPNGSRWCLSFKKI